MVRPERVETLEDVKHWISDHDARIDVFWDNQHTWNEKAETKMSRNSLRITSAEKRMIFWSGAAAAIGALIGGGGGSFFKAVFGS